MSMKENEGIVDVFPTHTFVVVDHRFEGLEEL